MGAVAIVVCSSSDLDVLVPLSGKPLLVRAVESLLGTDGVGRVHVLLPHPAEHTRVFDACAGLPVVVHPHDHQRGSDTGSNGSGTLRRISGSADAIVVHDLAWALVACADVLPRVLAGIADGHAAVVPVVPLTDTVKDVDRAGLVVGTPDRAGLRVVQTPRAYRPAVLDRVAGTDVDPATPGLTVHTVAGDPAAFALRTHDDVEFARAVIRGEQT